MQMKVWMASDGYEQNRHNVSAIWQFKLKVMKLAEEANGCVVLRQFSINKNSWCVFGVKALLQSLIY